MTQWWRAYAEAQRDPKIQALPGEMFKAWFNLCCWACEHDGEIPSLWEAAFGLHVTKRKAQKFINGLVERGLLAPVPGRYYVVVDLEYRIDRERPDAAPWMELRRQIFERDDFTCQYCGERGGKLECDHKIPVSRGGSHDPSNLTTACFACNRSKRAKTVEEWLS